MIKVSHESPLMLLATSKSYNDYDYALVHLFEQYPEYHEFFKQSLTEGRTVYLDNSIFELKTAFNSHEFVKYVKELYNINQENFYYIVPDVLEDCDNTIKQFEDFMKLFNQGNKIGVVQGENLDDLIKCFKFMKANADVVAISFDYSYYLEGKSENMSLEERYMQGRIEFMNYLKDEGLLEGTKIHLLGCFLPQEFSHYPHTEFPEIVSLDTSNPVVHGILGVPYQPYGLDHKESTMLVDLIEYQGDTSLILDNVQKFKGLLK